MKYGIGRCCLALGVIGLLAAGSLVAGPLVASSPGLAAGSGAEWSPVEIAPIDAAPADARTAQRVREIVYASIKDKTGVEPEVLHPAMELLTAAAREARVDMDAIYLVSDAIADPDSVAWAEAILVGYAEFIAFGQPVEGILPPEAEAIWVQALKKAAIGRAGTGFESIGRGLDLNPGIDPMVGGVCKTCAQGVASPDFPIASFPAPGTYGFHSSSTSSAGDCNWYSFPVEPGHRYEFRTCTPGSATFDTIISVFTDTCGAQPCGTPWANDDALNGCGNKSVVEIVAPLLTSTLYVRVSGFASAFGAYTLAYREMICPNCATAPLEITPTTTCQYVIDSFVNGGTSSPGCFETWFRVNLTGGAGYVFTTCPSGAGAVCPLANATPSTFDTDLYLYAPLDCSLGPPLIASTGSVSCSTAPTNRALISFTAPFTGQYLLRLRGPFAGNARFGCYTFGYVQTTVPVCGNCATGPFLATLTPTSTCQIQSGIVTTCQDTWYLINNTILQPLEFSTCSLSPPDCSGGSGTFDTTIELYNAACMLLQQDGDSCGGTRDRFCTSSGPGDLPPGTYKLRVRGGGVGSFNLTYRSCGASCTPVTNMTLAPSTGVASSGIGTCLNTQTFVLSSDGSPVVSYTWTITPPPGGLATPSVGLEFGAPSSGNAAVFTSTLKGEGIYTVTACATNGCTLPPECITIAYDLRDVTPPVLTIPTDTTVPCTSVPPAPTLAAQDNCDPNPAETFAEVRVNGPCDGEYVLQRSWSALDRSGNSVGPLTQTITVEDNVGPTIVPGSPGVYDYCMWPPNHEMHCFSASDFSPIITDNCSLPVTWKMTGCTNSEAELEPCGDGNIDPDCVISPDGQFVCLRSERCGNDPAENDGRIYGIYIVATDACGNESAPTLAGQVIVVHDQSDHSDCIEP